MTAFAPFSTRRRVRSSVTVVRRPSCGPGTLSMAAVAVALTLAQTAPVRAEPQVGAPIAGTSIAAADAAGTGSGTGTGTEPGPAPDSDTDVEATARALGKYLAGRTAQYDNDIAGAADHYGAALAADPDSPRLMRRAYFYLAADGRVDEAMAVADRAVSAIPVEDFAPLLLAVDAMRAGDPQTAVDRLAALEPRGINGLIQPLTLAWARLAAGDPDGAEQALEPARRMASASRLVDLHAAMLADVAGDPDRAAARIDAYLKDGPPENARPLELLVTVLVRLDRADEARAVIAAYSAREPVPMAVRDLAARLALDPQTEASDPVTTATDGFAEALYHSGLVFSQGQAAETGIVLMRLALAVRPGLARAAVAIAEILRRLEQYAASNAVLSGLALEGRPTLDYLVRLYRAENLENLDRIEDALADYDALAAAFPEQVEPLVDKGDLLRRSERFSEAAEAYGRAIDRLEPDAPMLWPVLYRRGIVFERAGAWDRAEADFLRALDLHPDQPEVLNYLGYSWLDRGENIERAVDMVREAVRQRPNDGYIVDSLGWGYYLLGRFDEAVTELERAVELRPQDWTINDHLGDAYWRVGRRTEARFQWERALSLEPDPDVAETIRHKLSEGLPRLDPRGPGAPR